MFNYSNNFNQTNDSNRPEFIDVKTVGKLSVGSVNIVNLAKWMKHNVPFKIVPNAACNTYTFYMYENGKYCLCSDNQFKGIIKAQIDAYDPQLVSTRVINEVFNLITMTPPDSISLDDFNDDENLIGFKNGVLHLDTMQLTPHSPDNLLTIQIPCEWKGGDSSTPVFDAFMDTLTNGDADTKKLLLQIIGVCLSNICGYRFKKAFFLYGPGNTGKSQLRKLIEMLIGKENCFSTGLKNLEERFGVGNIYQKRMVGSADMGFMSMDELEIFKQLTGGDSVQADMKYRAAISFVYKGILLFCTNALPKFGGDNGEWVYKRFCIIECNNVIPEAEQDKALCEKMYAERDGIVFKAVSALKEVIANNYTLTESSKVIDARSEYQKENSVVIRFFQECMVSSVGMAQKDVSTASFIYKAFAKWCMSNNNKYTISNSQFKAELAKHLGVKEENLLVHTNTGTHIFGYTLTNDAQILYV